MDQITNLLTRGVEKIYPSKEELEKVLRSGKKLRLYQGFDPTGIQMHIGHLVGLRKLRQFQDLGHEVIFLIGDGTGQAGDPSGKTRAREKFLKITELKANAKDYVMQAEKVVKFEGENAAKIVYNSDWLNKLTLPEILDIAGYFSLQQLSERDMFQERIKRGENINLREFLYPVLQAYDSVHLEVDLEIGGTDQTFNMLAGRSLLKSIKNRNKFVMTLGLITDSKGTKIGKTESNVIALTDKPENLYGKIMSLGDDVIIKSIEYLTNITLREVSQIAEEIQKGNNPMIYKKRLAFEIVSDLNSKAEAQKAQKYFEESHQEGKVTAATIVPATPNLKIVDILVNNGFVKSRSDAKRLISQGGLDIDGVTVRDHNTSIKTGQVVKVGKFKSFKVE